jgi:hypothetical protein
MAVDTASKRYAMMGLGAPHRFVAPVPDGTIAQADRQQFLYGYPGILWDEPDADDPRTVTGTWEVPAWAGTWEVPSRTGAWESL